MEVQHIVSAGRTRTRHGQSCAGNDYDLLAYLADAAAAAPLGAPAFVPKRQPNDRIMAVQSGPSSESQFPVRHHTSGGPISPSLPTETDNAGTTNLHCEREVRVTCNGTLGTFLIPSQTVQCHCARCAPEGAPGESHGIAMCGGPGAQQPPQHYQAPAITPTEFERHSGLLTAKKWRNSIRLVHGDGTITIGKWLEQHNILPRPKCSGPLGSPGPGGSGTMAALYGSCGIGADGVLHAGGAPSGNDNSHTAMGGGAGHIQGGAIHAQLGRCTLPPSRYPASEYVTGEDDEYNEMGPQHGSAADGADGDGLIAGEDLDGAVDDADYEDGLYGYAAEAAGSHGGRGGRRSAAHRGGRPSVTGLRTSERRGAGRALGRQGGGSRAPAGRGQRARQAVLQRGGTLACAQQQQQQQGRVVANSPGAAAGNRGSGSGAGRGASSQEEGEEEEGMGKGNSSSEGSPPSDDSKRRGGSGGSGEGDGSGTGDVGDSRRPGPAGAEGEHRTAEGGPDCPRRSTRHGPVAAKASQLQQQHPYQGFREGSADDPNVPVPERSTRHAAAIKRLPPEYLTGAEIGPLLKRARTRPSGAASAGGGSGSGSWGLGGGDELVALYDMAAVVAAPQVRGWRFLGASADPAVDQVLISVNINGRTYTGLLAPYQSAPSPPPPPPTATAAAGVRALLPAPAGSNAAAGGGEGSGGNSGVATAVALSARRLGGLSGSGGRAPTSSTGHTILSTQGPASRLVTATATVTAAAAGLEDGEMSLPAAGAAAGELTDPAAAAAAAAAAPTVTVIAEDEIPDDGMPPDCPRCALCHRCTSPVLSLAPQLTPSPASLPSPSLLRGKIAAAATATAAGPGVAMDGGASCEMSQPAEIANVTLRDGAAPELQGQEAAPDAKLTAALKLPADDAAAAVLVIPESGTVCDDKRGAPSGATPAGEEAAAGGMTGRGAVCSSGGSTGEEALVATDRKPSLCASSDGVKAKATATLPPELEAAAEVPAAIKMEVKNEGDLKGDAAAPASPLEGQQQAAVRAAAPPEASRTARQAGCGLGPLVEVRCSTGDGAGAGSSAGAGAGAPAPTVVHSQCALWSAEVFVIGGAMYGVAALIRRSRGQRCAHCGRSGASLSCSSGKCGRTYHLPCAMEAGAMLVAEPYSMACPFHRSAAGPHMASSTGAPGRLLPPRVKSAPAPQQETSQSTATTAGGSASQPNPPLSRSHSQQGQNQSQQVPLPLSLQLATGRRVVLPPLVPAAATEAAAVAPPHPPPHPRASKLAADVSSLPVLMMLRTLPEGSQVAASAPLAHASSSMPPPPPQRMEATLMAAASPSDNACDDEGVDANGTDQILQLNAEAGEPPTKRSRAFSVDGQWRSGSGGADAPAGSDGGGNVKAPATALATWAQGEPPVFERRLASAAATAGAAGISMLVNKHDGAAAPASMSSAHLEMSVASEGAAAVNSLTQGQGQAQATGSHIVKRRREATAAPEGAAAAAAAATEAAAGATTSSPASDKHQLAIHRESTPAVACQRTPTPTQLQQQQQLPRSHAPLGQAGSGATTPLFSARGGAAVAGVPAAADGCSSGVAPPGDTLSLGLGLGLDPASGLHLAHASALKLLQQHPQLGSALPEGVAAMLLGVNQNHHHHHHQHHNNNSIGSNSGGGGLRQGGEVSVGSHGSTAAQTQPPRGMPGGGGGRSRHHHHHHSSSQNQMGVAVGASASTASASTATAFGRGANCRGGGGEESPPLQFHLPAPIQQQQYSGGSAGMLVHMLPRAARNIEGLLPSRPLLHNPYVPSSGDPSADLVLSKIAHNGSREVEAELLGGTTGRVGHTGRCAVCVIQRKGKCGTESAPKKCLRRQLVALQRATGAGGAANLIALSGLSSAGGMSGVSGGSVMTTDDTEEAPYVHVDGSGGAAVAATPALYLDERVAAAAAEQRARERARRETWSLPLGMGSGATGKRPPPQEQFAAT